ncbi:MAG: DUF4149 domain-containing protein [Candidatus Omnitrophica bacterium]|nr:DUF4149 domain-containing protein [Candidatus Omnitrophota bacterium]
MPALKICVSVALALWVGGLSLFVGTVIPVSFRSFKKEEAGRFLEVLFPAVDRWCLVWGAAAAGALFLLFRSRHLAPASLALELPVGLMFLLTLYVARVLHPEVHELKRKINLPEFEGSAHQQTMKFAFDRLYKVSVRLHGLLLLLGWFSLGLVPSFLR